jgi:hypothetical protein
MQQQSSTNGSAKQSIQRTLATSLQGQPLLGYCIYWSFSERKTTHTEFTDLLKSVGMPTDIAPETRAKSAVAKAIEHYVGSTKGGKLRDKVVDDKDKTLWVIVQRAVDSVAQDVSYETEIKIAFLKKTSRYATVLQSVNIDGGTPEVQEQLKGLIQDYFTAYTTDQIRASILTFIQKHCEGVTVRENGGLYFIPAMYEKQFNQLESLFNHLDKTSPCSVGTIPILDDARAAAAMWEALKSDARKSMTEMRKDIEKLQKDPSDRSYKLRMNQFHDLKTKIEMYEVLLNGTAKDLVAELAAVEASFREKILS